jgi:hypothetical protein
MPLNSLPYPFMKLTLFSIIICLVFCSTTAWAQLPQDGGIAPNSEQYSVDFERVNNELSELLTRNYSAYFRGGHELIESYSIASTTGLHVTYSHFLEGLPVYDSEAKFHFDKNGELVFTQNGLVAIQPHRLNNAKLPADGIWINTEGELKLGQIGRGGTARNPTSYLKLGGQKISEEFQKLYFQLPDSTVKAKVFMVNPINSAGVDYGGKYTDNKDSNNAYLEAELKVVEMRVLYENDTFYLGDSRFQFKNVIDPATPRVISTTDSFFFNRSDTEFEDVNAFYHLSNYAKYITQIGYKNLLFDSLIVDATAGLGDESAFDPSPNPKTLEFGLGNVDDAEDGEVVIHELAHALSTKASPLSVKGNDRQAMEEGNCDYLSSSYSMKYSSHKDWKVFSWDGHNEFWSGFVNNSYKNYKTDRTGFRDNDREIWSSALTCVRGKLGAGITDSLVLEHLFYQAKNKTMPDMANVILRMDTLQNNAVYSWAIRTCFVDHGILEPASVETIQSLPGITIKNSLNFARGSGNLEIEFEHPRPYEIELFDFSGKLISRHSSNQRSWTLSPETMLPGTYVLMIRTENEIFQGKLSKF